MKHLMKFIKTNLNSKWLYKTICLFFIIWIFVGVPVFAQEEVSSTQESIRFFGVAIETILSLLSRLWIFLASIAGKLMTNDRVYGSAFHLDIYLWKVWNIMKNFANFTLAALVLVEVVKIAIWKSGALSKVFVNTLIAAVMIQASRFVMWAVIDISNVTLSAVWSFPRAFMQDSDEFMKWAQTYVENFQELRYEIDLKNDKTTKTVEKKDLSPEKQNSLIQSILPDTNSVSGPLIFIWASIFRFNEINSIAGMDKIDWGKITLSVTMRLLVIVFYTIALLFLVIANIIRIWFLWMFIVLSPIIVLFFSFLKKWNEGITKYFDISSVLKSVFKPTIFVWYISLMLIVLLLVRTFFVKNPDTEIWWVQIYSTEELSRFSIPDVGNIEIKWNLFDDAMNQWQSMFSDIVVFLLWIFLMRQLVKLALKDEWPVWKAMNSMWINQDLLKGVVSNMPVLPWWFWVSAYRNAMTQQTQKTLEKAGINWNGKWWDRASVEANLDKEWEAALEQKIIGITWWKISWNRNTHGKTLEKTIANREGFWWESQKIASEIEWWLSFNNPEWMWYIKDWMDKVWSTSGFEWTLDWTSEEQLKKFFELNRWINVKKFHEYMSSSIGFKNPKGTTSAPTNYEELKSITYGTVEKTE